MWFSWSRLKQFFFFQPNWIFIDFRTYSFCVLFYETWICINSEQINVIISKISNAFEEHQNCPKIIRYVIYYTYDVNTYKFYLCMRQNCTWKSIIPTFPPSTSIYTLGIAKSKCSGRYFKLFPLMQGLHSILFCSRRDLEITCTVVLIKERFARF